MAKGLKKMLKNPMVLLVIVVIVVLVFSSQKSGFTSDNLNSVPSCFGSTISSRRSPFFIRIISSFVLVMLFNIICKKHANTN